MIKKAIFIFSILLFTVVVFAHECFFSVNKYKVQQGDMLEVHLFIADGFNVQLEKSLQKKNIRKFELITQKGTVDLLGVGNENDLPILNRKVDFTGLGLLHMERDYARISLPTKKFLAYLKEDHLENIQLKKDSLKQVQKERYSRYIKTLVQSGDKPIGDEYKKVVGQNFEIVLLQNPYTLKPGSRLKAKILFMGNPLVNKVITARNRTGSQSAQVALSRTDAKGICTFKINRNGEWFLHATHIIECPDKTDSDWESFWATYSFQIGG